MKIFLAFIFFLLLSNCSFDNKSGIWTNNNNSDSKTNNEFKDFELLYSKTKTFDKLINPKENLEIILDPIIENYKWVDENYRASNNIDNFYFKDKNKAAFKSKKLSKSKIKSKFLLENQNAVFTDTKGNIIIYSIKDQKIVLKYNFYKKKYKKVKKVLNTIIENNIIYVSDNFGYLYALDYLNDKLIWAQNYKIPFRSNLKIIENKILIADINNSLYFINKTDGEKLKVIPTEETIIKNDFKNSLGSIKNTLYFLNTYGSLYSIDKNGRIKWFFNLNQSMDINPSSLFNSKTIVLHNNRIIVSTDLFLYILDSDTGSTLFKIAITSILKPIVSGENLFLVTKDNLLVCININSFKIEYSIDLAQKIANFLEIKKKKFIDIKSLVLVNNDLLLFLNNSYFVKLSLFGDIKKIEKLSSKINSDPIFVDGSLIYIDNKNKLFIKN